MLTWLEDIWNDSAKFTAFVRGLIAIGGAAVSQGWTPLGAGHEGLGLLIIAASQMIAAGEANSMRAKK